MTIRGSAVQEDASSGIWELEDFNDGLRLTITRAKGKGRGNYRLFNWAKVFLPDKDSYGDALQGIVPVHYGGTENENKSDRIETLANERRAWAKAVIGALEVYPSENPEGEDVGNNITDLSKFLTKMWVNRKDDLAALDFAERWMDLIQEHKQMCNVFTEGQHQQARDSLDKEFADMQPVTIGEYVLKIEKKTGTREKYQFTVGATEE